MVAGNHHHDKTQVGPEKQDDDERAAAANTAATQGARDTEEDELIKDIDCVLSSDREGGLGLGEFVDTDKDGCIELIVDIKEEPLDDEALLSRSEADSEDDEEVSNNWHQESENDEHYEANTSGYKGAEFADLSTLAEVSLAAAGKILEPSLQEEINRARQRLETPTIPLSKYVKDLILANSGAKALQNQAGRIDCSTGCFPHQSPTNATTTSDSLDFDSDPEQGHSGHQCGECGKTYSTSSNLARHRQTHRSLDDTKAKKCQICQKVYVSMPAFSMHMRTHNQNCKCSLCGKTFSRPWLLQGHLRTHTGERPYTCQVCYKAFADRSNLRAHVQTHSKSKPYKCNKCGRKFALKSYLYKHEEGTCPNGS